MEWKTEQFGSSHEGRPGAVLTDGEEPKPVYFDVGSGANFHKSTDWWVYDGTFRAPRATNMRGSCSCGWRGESLYPIDWSEVDKRVPGAYDTSGPYEDWEGHIASVEAQSVPLPAEVEDLVQQLDDKLADLSYQAPLAALKAVAALERIAVRVGRDAAYEVQADELSPETVAKALGLAEEKVRSRLLHYSLKR
ncbi:hypothetical protein HUT18_14355 [Streptomyces sp. NA04227]|uniref:hypothetical protein n=1 Tax=Streptomyces sp. NA04227 TaxID=2742136 RepID=UPI001591C674|nr:hypothetical protein [Streptomyces sp. NA04227]QKW07392.1 hypothetical protein HUT18_14355 [Streptomyces sp. NA04227]